MFFRHLRIFAVAAGAGVALWLTFPAMDFVHGRMNLFLPALYVVLACIYFRQVAQLREFKLGPRTKVGYELYASFLTLVWLADLLFPGSVSWPVQVFSFLLTLPVYPAAIGYFALRQAGMMDPNRE